MSCNNTGYQYRLCKVPHKSPHANTTNGSLTWLTEECFLDTPLDFVKGEQSIVFPNGTQLRLTSEQTTFVTKGQSDNSVTSHPPCRESAGSPASPPLRRGGEATQQCLRGGRGNPSTTTRCGSLLPSASADVHASDDAIALEGTFPPGSMWSLMPMPPTLLGPCCLAGAEGYDNASIPHSCRKSEGGSQCFNTAPCEPCPGTPGSDCSRCDQVGRIERGRYKIGAPFPEPCPGCSGVDWNGYSVRDVVKIPNNIPAGEYIMGFRYDCETTAQVWSNCADVVVA